MPPDPGVGWTDPDQENVVAEYRKTKTAGVYVRHQTRCPATGGEGGRCRCQPSYRGRRWEPSQRRMVWSDTFKERAEVLSWLAATVKGQEAVEQAEAFGPTLRALADEWLDGVHTGAVGRRRGKKATGYSPTTLEGYERSLRYALVPEFGSRPASEIDDREWQMWGRPAESRGPVAVADRKSPGRGSRDLRVGESPDAKDRRSQPAPGRRVAAER